MQLLMNPKKNVWQKDVTFGRRVFNLRALCCPRDELQSQSLLKALADLHLYNESTYCLMRFAVHTQDCALSPADCRFKAKSCCCDHKACPPLIPGLPSRVRFLSRVFLREFLPPPLLPLASLSRDRNVFPVNLQHVWNRMESKRLSWAAPDRRAEDAAEFWPRKSADRSLKCWKYSKSRAFEGMLEISCHLKNYEPCL